MKNLAVLLLLTISAFAQGGAYQGPTVVNGVGQPIASASVAITTTNPCGTSPTYTNCNGQAQGIYSGPTPPASLATIYTDVTLGTQATNPIKSDPLGNWSVYAQGGTYWGVIYGYQIVPQVVVVVVSSGTGGGGGSTFKIVPNCSSTGTFVNETVQESTQVVGGVTEVCGTVGQPGSTSVIGICASGCGTTGLANIAVQFNQACVMDNQGTANHYVTPSSSIQGFCSDAGAVKPAQTIETLGIVSVPNSGGAGNNATVQLAPLSLLLPGATSGSGVVQNPNCVGTPIAYYPSGLVASVQGDCFTALDGAGHGQMKGIGLTDTSTAGFLYQTQGTQPTLAASNSIYHFAPTSVPTTYGFQWPSAGGTGCLFGTPSGSVVTLSFQNPCGGGGGIGTASASNPGQPTVTPGGTPGATTYTYGIIGCQDTSCIYHSKISTLGSTTTGNATLSTSNYNTLTAYADTLYGYRGYLICRTVGGATQGIITTNLLVGKQMRDTGLTGDGTNCATAYSANTTILSPFCLGSANPGTPTTPGFPCGVDAPPLAPNALDDEMMASFGAPGDVNNTVWQWCSGGTSAPTQGSATAAWSGGSLLLTTDTTTQLNALCMNATLPTAPYTFEVWVSTLEAPASNSQNACVIGLRESSTGKMTTFEIDQTQTVSNGAALGAIVWITHNWSNNTTPSNHKYLAYSATNGYLKIQVSGSNVNYSFSDTGNGVNYFAFDTQAITSAFTTAPDQLLIGGIGASGVAAKCTFDFVRRTQ